MLKESELRLNEKVAELAAQLQESQVQYSMLLTACTVHGCILVYVYCILGLLANISYTCTCTCTVLLFSRFMYTCTVSA